MANFLDDELTPFGWQELAEDILIRVYVPEADQMSHQDALRLAQERDIEAARNLYIDVAQIQLDLVSAAKVAAEL
jgi:hypothetical protein